MEVLNTSLSRLVALGLCFVLLAPGLRAVAAPLPQASGSQTPGPQSPASTGTAADAQKPSDASSGQSASPQVTTPTPQAQEAKPEAPAAAGSPETPPVGTAVAPYVKPGGSGARPSGAAIAPVKQKRIRTFAIRAGLLVGAGIAIGVVTAATLGSSSRPH